MSDLTTISKLAQNIADHANVLNGGKGVDDETLESNILEIQDDAEKIVQQADALVLVLAKVITD